jgi:hypothetical protein
MEDRNRENSVHFLHGFKLPHAGFQEETFCLFLRFVFVAKHGDCSESSAEFLILMFNGSVALYSEVYGCRSECMVG